MMTAIAEEQVCCVVDGAAGIYCPQFAAERLTLGDWGIDDETNNTLLAGPNIEDDEGLYWEAWDLVLNNAEMVGPGGHNWTLWQNQDVFMVRDDVDSSFFEN